MKKSFSTIVIAASAVMMTSCGSTQSLYLESFAPEEVALNLVKITDESNNSVMAGTLSRWNPYFDYTNTASGISKSNGVYWSTVNALDISPDGEKIAYVTRMNKQDNVMVRSTRSGGVATQRTFRNVGSFSWGADNKLYFSDYNRNGTSWNSYICSVNAEAGSLMNQHTSGSVSDGSPVVTSDGSKIYFVRNGSGGPSIWSLGKDGTLTSCARGYNPCLIKGNDNAFYCVRNSSEGRSEIWFVDFVKGQESLVLADNNKSFTNPKLSPDGKWIVCVGNSVSSISQKQNLDIYVVRTDGTRLTQLTYHPETDTCPVWSADGKSIFFITSRANEKQSFNIWRMNFNIEE